MAFALRNAHSSKSVLTSDDIEDMPDGDMPDVGESMPQHRTRRGVRSPPEFPVSGSKPQIIAWIIDKLNWDLDKECREVKWWKSAFIGQLIFWVTIFVTGKTWLGWFPIP